MCETPLGVNRREVELMTSTASHERRFLMEVGCRLIVRHTLEVPIVGLLVALYSSHTTFARRVRRR